MGMLGKILLFVNLVAFVGLAYFATQNWAARNAAASNALIHQIALTGMPVTPPEGVTGDDENIPLGTVVSGFYPVSTVRPSILREHFKNTNTGYASLEFPKTQLDEVNGVSSKLTAELSQLKTDEIIAKLGGTYTAIPNSKTVRFVPGILANMAETTFERVLIRKLSDNISDPKKRQENAETLVAILNRKFETLKKVDPRQADADAATLKERIDAVRVANDKVKRAFDAFNAVPMDADMATKTSAAQAAATAGDELTAEFTKFQKALGEIGTTVCRDENDRKKRIVHLLMHLDESAAWQKRVALTVGLRTYLTALSDHANRLQRFASVAEQQVILDQARFADEYEVLKNLAINQSLLLKQETAVRADLETQKAKDVEFTKIRLDLLATRRKTLDDINVKMQAMMAAQAETQKRLFDVQKLVGETMSRNFDLEKQLEAAEVSK
ncbi:MAG: hypothetical protein ACRC8S_20785 [Fimbriiglobus sp.]